MGRSKSAKTETTEPDTSLSKVISLDVEDSSASADQLEKALSECRAQLMAATSDLTRQKGMVKALLHEKAMMHDKLKEADNAILTARELEATNTEERRQRDAFRERVGELEAQLGDTNAALAAMRTEHARVADRHQLLEVEHGVLKDQLAQALRDRDALTREVDELRQEQALLSENAARLQEGLDQLEASERRACASEKALEERVAELSERTTALTLEVEQKNRVLETYEEGGMDRIVKDMKERKSQVEQLRETVRQMEGEVARKAELQRLLTKERQANEELIAALETKTKTTTEQAEKIRCLEQYIAFVSR